MKRPKADIRFTYDRGLFCNFIAFSGISETPNRNKMQFFTFYCYITVFIIIQDRSMHLLIMVEKSVNTYMRVEGEIPNSISRSGDLVWLTEQSVRALFILASTATVN